MQEKNYYEGVNSTGDTYILSVRIWRSYDKEQRKVCAIDQNFWCN